MLSTMGIPFRVVTATVDESVLSGERPDDYLDRITQSKLRAVQDRCVGVAGAVLVADTVVIDPCGTILCKPVDPPDAERMIERLAGATHRVGTRFLLASSDTGSPAAHAETVITHVAFRSLSTEEVRQYAATGEGRDKAGGYAIQGRAAAFIERIDGSYTNVVGLPLSEVVVALTSLGWLSRSR
jgi:septum formation protein